MLLLVFTALQVFAAGLGGISKSVLRSSFQFLDILSDFLKKNSNLAIVRASYDQLSCAESCLVQIYTLPRAKLPCYRIFMHRILFMTDRQIHQSCLQPKKPKHDLPLTCRSSFL